METKNKMVTQLNEIFNEFQDMRSRSAHDDISDQAEAKIVRFITRARALVHRIAGAPSAYVAQCDEIMVTNAYPGHKAQHLFGVVDSLRADVAAGYMESHEELIHSELFADFLDMAKHLLEEGYKDPAAVVAGSSLEAHIRQLCKKAGIDIEITGASGVVPKKADRLNVDLAKAKQYSILDQKNVTAWLDLRNKAAHGHYDQYEPAQVELLISGVRDFMSRNPA